MIKKVTIRRFKRFEEVEIPLPGHVVVAGPNNTGKTTLLQAIAAWDLALRRWRENNDLAPHNGYYARAPVARQAFTAVPLRNFDLLWRQRDAARPIEIEVTSTAGWRLGMELIPDTSEQILVRPLHDVAPDVARTASEPAVFVPAMTGLATEEPLYANREFLDLRLSQGRPGDILRNLLVEASHSETAWPRLVASIRDLFGYSLEPPDPRGAHIIAEYSAREGGPRFDIASAGSGFQQVLMLLAFLHTRARSVLLLDEPDAHLHVILQDAIFGELKAVAVRQQSQLVIATHSEVIIDSADPAEICVLLDRPRFLADSAERRTLVDSLGCLSNEDIMLAMEAPGVLYLEDWTDLQVLREWATILDHRAKDFLKTNAFWKKTSHQQRPGAEGIPSRKHFDALQLVRNDLPGLELVDGDARPEIRGTEIIGRGYQRLRWRRYEIESYLVHPAALERFVEKQVGPAAFPLARDGLRGALAQMLGGAAEDFTRNPLNPPALVETFLENRKARTDILPPLLTAAGLLAFPYTRYHELAAVMRPEEIHVEVQEKLDGIMRAFGL